MNAKQLYLAWLRTAHPDIYKAAMQKMMGQRALPAG
jgi:hypothetical protein